MTNPFDIYIVPTEVCRTDCGTPAVYSFSGVTSALVPPIDLWHIMIIILLVLIVLEEVKW